jgi:hypothetical protein
VAPNLVARDDQALPADAQRMFANRTRKEHLMSTDQDKINARLNIGACIDTLQQWLWWGLTLRRQV